MAGRRLQSGKVVPELEKPVKLVIETKCPEKWKIIDMETGEAYVGTDKNKKFHHWKLDHNMPELKQYMERNKEIFVEEMEKIHAKLDEIIQPSKYKHYYNHRKEEE